MVRRREGQGVKWTRAHVCVACVCVLQEGKKRGALSQPKEAHSPLVLEDVQANAAAGVDVGVVDFGVELDLGGLEGIVRGEFNGEEEHAPLVGAVPGTHDRGLPGEHVIPHGARAAVGWRVTSQVQELTVDAFCSPGRVGVGGEWVGKVGVGEESGRGRVGDIFLCTTWRTEKGSGQGPREKAGRPGAGVEG